MQIITSSATAGTPKPDPAYLAELLGKTADDDIAFESVGLRPTAARAANSTAPAQYTCKLDAAQAHARAGFAVFPLIPNEKLPAIKNWQNLATTDATQIAEWWRAWPQANIGIVTTPYLVVDIDPRNGGTPSFASLMQVQEFPPTLRSRTGGGGSHIFYRLPERTVVKGGKDKLAKGVDIKSWGGLVVAPGSTVNGRAYAWLNDLPMAIAPQWLIERCHAPRPKSDKAGKRVVEEDAIAVEMATDYILHHAPVAVLGELKDTAFRVACKLFDKGVSTDTATELLRAWGTAKCEPPLEDDTVAHTIRSALAYRGNAIGNAHPLAPAGFEAVDLPAENIALFTSKAEAERDKFYIIRGDESASRALRHPREMLVDGLLQTEAEAVMVGAPGGGKTFLGLDLCYHIAKGLPWFGRAVIQGAAVYIATEAQEGINTRVAALEAHYGPLGDAPLFIIPCPADLAHGSDDTNALVKLINATCGKTVRLVVIDTLARAIAGGDDSNAKDMGAVIMAAGRIRRLCHTSTMLIHHPGKDAKKGARGSSHLLGAVDTEITLKNFQLSVTKQRDMVCGAPLRFVLVPVNIGADDKSKAVWSCYVDPRRAGDNRGFEINLSETERKIIQAIDEAILDLGDIPFEPKFVIKEYAQRHPTAPRDDSTIRGCVGKLLETGWLRESPPNRYIRERWKTLDGVGKIAA